MKKKKTIVMHLRKIALRWKLLCFPLAVSRFFFLLFLRHFLPHSRQQSVFGGAYRTYSFCFVFGSYPITWNSLNHPLQQRETPITSDISNSYEKQFYQMIIISSRYSITIIKIAFFFKYF